MCIGGGGRSYPQPQRPEFDDSPPVVTGMQTGVENPKDTKKATEELKIRISNCFLANQLYNGLTKF